MNDLMAKAAPNVMMNVGVDVTMGKVVNIVVDQARSIVTHEVMTMSRFMLVVSVTHKVMVIGYKFVMYFVMIRPSIG